MKVVVTEAAWEDMLQIGQSIAQDSPSRANSFLNELYDRCLQLGDMPRAYPLVSGKDDAGIRRRPYGNYLIFYRLAEAAVEVLRVVHGARDYERLLFSED